MAIQRSDCCVMSEERQKERREICPVESIIEWWHNGAYTPSKDCVISIKQLKKQTLLICLWACSQITAKCICNRLMILSVFNTQILCIISHWGLTSQGNNMQGKKPTDNCNIWQNSRNADAEKDYSTVCNGESSACRCLLFV